MSHTYVDNKSLKTLEDYAVFLGAAMVTLETLHNLQVRAIEIGIMPADMNERAIAIMWNLHALMKRYEDQVYYALETIGDDIDIKSVVDTMKKKELVRARAMTRKMKVPKTDNEKMVQQ